MSEPVCHRNPGKQNLERGTDQDPLINITTNTCSCIMPSQTNSLARPVFYPLARPI